ncbi:MULTISPECIES: zinc metallopeptidase [Atopobiaceae]|uniref:zinc metallopeptidase n=1 Tax=Atopobiaceae TaxID=1643824 RepID=UPI000B380052|nr:MULTISPECIES: zinc metallopeptidase [Atopobiaceae]MCR8908599.1 zinc metallopeptidase [Thermophilibacter sp. ET337]OUO32746.1 peptidase [Olsenella sp. An293]
MPLYYGFGYGMDMEYLLVALVALVIGGAAQAYIRSTYAKWARVPANVPGTGADVARRMLAEGGAEGVGITRVAGSLTDHYDPRDNRLHLSDDNYHGASVASVAVACHEAGHAIQAARGFGLYRLRTALVPAVNIAQQGWVLVLLAGILLNLAGLVRLAIVLFAVAVVFQLVTLPVEIDASRRAVAYLSANGSGMDERGARSVLTAAALTYVAAALTSIMQLLYLLSRYGGRGGGDQ